MLAGLQRLVAIAGIGRRGVAGNEDLGRGGRSERSIDDDPAELIPRAGDLGRERRGGHAGRQHHGVGSENAAVGEADTVCRQGLHRGAEAQLDTGGRHRRLDLRPRPGPKLPPDGLGPVDQHDAQSLGRTIGAVHQQPVAQLERQLDAGEARADDGDGRLRDVTGDLAQAPIEGDRLRLGVDRKRRLGAWHRGPTHAAAGRDDQAVIGEAIAGGERHGFGGGVEPGRLAAHEADVDLVQERQQVDSERLGPRLVEPWPDFEHRLRRYQGHVCPGAGNSPGRDCRPEAGKAAADDQDLLSSFFGLVVGLGVIVISFQGLSET